MDTMKDLKAKLIVLETDLDDIEDKIRRGSEEYGLKIDRDNIKEKIMEIEDKIIRLENPEDFME